MGSSEALARRLGAALREIPPVPASGTWDAIAPALSHPTRRPRRSRLALLAAAALVILGMVAMAASDADLRVYAADLASGRGPQVGGRIASGRLASLYPLPPFRVFQPDIPAARLRLVAFAYNPGPLEVGPIALPRPDGVFAYSRIDGQEVPEEWVRSAASRARARLRQRGDPPLVLVYVEADGSLVELVQRGAPREALPAGDATLVQGGPAVFIAGESGESTLATQLGGTSVEITVQGGRAQASAVAARLRAWPLAPFEWSNPTAPG